MSNSILISYNNEEPPLDVSIDKNAILMFLDHLLEKRGYTEWELSVVFTSNSYIRNLNKTYRGIDMPTDVLSFEMGERYIDDTGLERFSAGDIVLSLESIQENAKTFCVSLNEELKRVLIHGVLHLEGMDHATNDDVEPMLVLQEKILKTFSNVKIVEEKVV